MRHDELNRLKDVIYPGGKRIDYSYDKVGHLHVIATSSGPASYDRTQSFYPLMINLGK